MEMIAKGWKIVIKSDGSDVGVGACMLLVKADTVSEITPELMLDPDRVRLLGVDSKVLSASERKWLTFEIEMYGMYRALRKWAGLLIQVSLMSPEVEIVLMMDSTTATAKWLGVSVPEAIDHACAKEKRFLGWAEKVSYLRYLRCLLKYLPGCANDFADMLSRMAERLHKCIAERELYLMCLR
jgi:hypothetical protein